MRRSLSVFWCVLFVALAFPADSAAQNAAIPEWVERYLASEPRGQKFGHAWIARARRLRALADASTLPGMPAPPPGRYSLKGEFRVAVLAGTFSDITPRYAPAEYRSAFFGTAGTNGSYTLAQYFREVSGGAFTFSGFVTDWITAERTRAYYIDNFSNGGRGRWTEYLQSILGQADATIDWAQFDNDGEDGIPNSGDDDGFVDMVIFLHPLADGVCRNDALGGFLATGFRLRNLFGRPYVTRSRNIRGELMQLDDFVLSAGLHCNGASIANMNINVHEMGHALGLPDLNDLDRSSRGVGVWDVMGYGLYAADGKPAHLGAWSRRQLGWANEMVPSGRQTIEVAPVEISRDIVRINVPNTNEYFLLENRQQILADAALPGAGLVVWHVDEDVLLPALPTYRGTENEERSGLAVVQADGMRALERNQNVGDAGDPFPGTTFRSVIADVTLPGLRGNLGAPSNAAVFNITQRSQNVVLEMTTNVAALEPVAFAPQTLPAALLGTQSYAAQLAASGGIPPYVFKAIDALPAGLSLDGQGNVTGEPQAIGTATFSVSVTDALQRVSTAPISVTVNMPAVAQGAAMQAVAGSSTLGDVEKRALDLVGNRNGRFDVGDVLLFIKRGRP